VKTLQNDLGISDEEIESAILKESRDRRSGN